MEFSRDIIKMLGECPAGIPERIINSRLIPHNPARYKSENSDNYQFIAYLEAMRHLLVHKVIYRSSDGLRLDHIALLRYESGRRQCS